MHGWGRGRALQGKEKTEAQGDSWSEAGAEPQHLTEYWLLHVGRMAKEDLAAGSHYCGGGGTAKLPQLGPIVQEWGREENAPVERWLGAAGPGDGRR